MSVDSYSRITSGGISKLTNQESGKTECPFMQCQKGEGGGNINKRRGLFHTQDLIRQ